MVVLPITCAGATKSTLVSRAARAKSASIEISITGREHAADVLTRRGDRVEVRGGPEVDDDARRAVALARRHRVHDPVRARPREDRRRGSECPS